MADVFCRRAQVRIKQLFEELFDNADDPTYRLAQDVLKGKHAWFEEGLGRGFDEIFKEGEVAPPAPGAGTSNASRGDERVATELGASG
jgi:hypothetical protein